MIACAIFSVGVALQTASTTIPLFVVGRVFAGLGVGVASCLVPMYQSECAPLSIVTPLYTDITMNGWLIPNGFSFFMIYLTENGFVEVWLHAMYAVSFGMYVFNQILTKSAFFSSNGPSLSDC
jgi:MFS family permease